MKTIEEVIKEIERRLAPSYLPFDVTNSLVGDTFRYWEYKNRIKIYEDLLDWIKETPKTQDGE